MEINEKLILLDADYSTIKAVVEGKLDRVPKYFWSRSTAIKAIRYVILNIYKYDKKDIYEKFTIRSLDRINLRSIRRYGTLYELIDKAIPEWNIKPWEIKKLPNEAWTPDLIYEAINWLVYEILDTTPEKARELITPTLLYKNKLGRVYKIFNNNVDLLLDTVFDKKYF